MELIAIHGLTIVLGIVILVLSGVLFYLFRSGKRPELHFSLLLLDVFVILRFSILLLSESSPKVHLYLHVASLLIISLALIKIFIKVFIQYFLEHQQKISIPKILQDLIQLGAFILVGVIILNEYFSLDTSILVTSSVLSIVIGLALQDTLGNFFAGLALQMQRPFEKGDWIMCHDNIGQVTDIDWRAIKIRTLNRDIYTIPNSEIAKTSFVNYSKPTRLHRLVIPMGVSYKSPPNFVKKVIMDILKEEIEEKSILKNPEPSIILVNYNDFSIDYEIRVFIDNFRFFKEVTDRIYTKIWYQFKRNDIVIPFPIRDVYLHEVKPEDTFEIIQNIRKSLKGVDFLSVLTDDELETLAKGVTVENFAVDEIIINQGDAGDTFYILEDGEVEVLYKDQDENFIPLKKLFPPAFFGELSLLTGSERTATVMARTDCELLTINSNTFKSIIMNNPLIADRISEIITGRQLELDRYSQDKSSEETINEKVEKSQNLLGKMKNFFGF
ncbi:MAG: mechanosensitive ion channel family protein [Cyanobacteriota bacterium]